MPNILGRFHLSNGSFLHFFELKKWYLPIKGEKIQQCLYYITKKTTRKHGFTHKSLMYSIKHHMHKSVHKIYKTY